ncbi:MAG: methyltransferase domain-containing protein [Candidatus Binatia bacterium]
MTIRGERLIREHGADAITWVKHAADVAAMSWAATEPTGPNADQIRYWDGLSGPKWVALSDPLDAQLAAYGERTMERLALHAGERVLDVGCGCGATTLALAERVAPGGAVMGIDVSRPMLARARERAAAAGAADVTFVRADAQTHPFAPPPFDALFSRFGVMFFADPAAAFANLRTALRPDGRIAFVCWQPLQRNPWMLVPLMAAAEHIALPPPPAPDAPGPFAFGDGDRVRRLLGTAGFTSVAIEPMEDPVVIGGTVDADEAARFILEVGPVGQALREADPGARPAVATAVRAALRPWLTADGIRMPAAAWIVTARA